MLHANRFRSQHHSRWSNVVGNNTGRPRRGHDRDLGFYPQAFQVRTAELLGRQADAQRVADAVKRFTLQLGTPATLATLVLPLFVLATPSSVVAQRGAGVFATGTITGTIVDSEGVPQMGALVQLLLPDTSLAGTAVTDVRGRYRLTQVTPGAYRVRASAALFLPIVRRHLVVAGNGHSVVNMTLSTMLSSTEWLPVSRRTAGEGDDDWMWTMRSSTMRPVLRLATDDEGNATSGSVSSSAEQPRAFDTAGRVTVQDNEGEFARGGTHNVLSIVRHSGDTVSILRADLSGPRTPFPVNPSADLTVGWERSLPLAGTSRTVLTYSSHPEVQGDALQPAYKNSGLQMAVLRNAQRMNIGSAVRLDAGTVTRDVNLVGNSFTVEPFLRLAVHPSSGVVIAYTFTESRGNETLEDLDRVRPTPAAAVIHDGRVQLERGSHQALGVSTRLPHEGVVELAVFSDRMDSPLLNGIGALPAADVLESASATDPTTASFLVAARNYQSMGVRLVVQQPVTSSVSLNASFASGRALRSTAAADATLKQAVSGLLEANAAAATVGIDGHFQRSGTVVHAGYRWQDESTLTAVDRFRSIDDTAYLHCQLRQSLHSLPLLPANLEAVLEVQNLLAEGYQPFVSHDGHTLYLAQSPRVLQAGLSFSF